MFQRFAGRAVCLVVFAALAGCSMPEQANHVAVKANAPDVAATPTSVPFQTPLAAGPHRQAAIPAAAAAHGIAATDATATAQIAPAGTIVAPVRKAAPAPFELVGTSISDEKAFAFLKQSGRDLVTVHEGDRVDGFTVARIAPDRIKLESSDHAEQVLTIATAAGPGAMPPMHETDSAAKIVGGINTDQSIPEHVTLGPTGSLPPGMKQMGH
jgi:hypothetical protein